MAATRQTIKWVKNVYGGGALYQSYPEGDNETYIKGTPLIFDVSELGVVEVALTSTSMTAAGLLGIATADAVNDTVQLEVDVLIPRVGDIFEASISTDQDTVVAPALEDLGESYNLQLLSSTGGAGGEYVVDRGDESVLVVKVIALHPQDLERRGSVSSLVAGDRVLFQFVSDALDTGSQA